MTLWSPSVRNRNSHCILDVRKLYGAEPAPAWLQCFSFVKLQHAIFHRSIILLHRLHTRSGTYSVVHRVFT